MRRLIRGKFDSRFKQVYNTQTMRSTGKLEQGYFMTAMDYARYTRGGVKMIQRVRNKPWDTWTPWTHRAGRQIPSWCVWLED